MNKYSTGELVTVAETILECEGNISKAADVLGMSRSKIYKIKKSNEFEDVSESLTNKISMADLDMTESVVLGDAYNVLMGDYGHYYNTDGTPKKLHELTPEQRSRIETYHIKKTKFGDETFIKLRSKDDSRKLLADNLGLTNPKTAQERRDASIMSKLPEALIMKIESEIDNFEANKKI